MGLRDPPVSYSQPHSGPDLVSKSGPELPPCDNNCHRELKRMHFTNKIRRPGSSILPLTFGDILVLGLSFLQDKMRGLN